jgi:hypothetical protein
LGDWNYSHRLRNSAGIEQKSMTSCWRKSKKHQR